VKEVTKGGWFDFLKHLDQDWTATVDPLFYDKHATLLLNFEQKYLSADGCKAGSFSRTDTIYSKSNSAKIVVSASPTLGNDRPTRIKIMIRINQERFIPALEKMTSFTMSAVVVGGVRDIQMSHEFLQVTKGGLNKKMIMVAHENIGQDRGLINLSGTL
jgi:hypothetical protein